MANARSAGVSASFVPHQAWRPTALAMAAIKPNGDIDLRKVLRGDTTVDELLIEGDENEDVVIRPRRDAVRGDTFWLRPDLLCIGRTLRTNDSGARQLAEVERVPVRASPQRGRRERQVAGMP